MILQKIILIVFSVLFFGNVSFAQRVWSLEKCIEHVVNNNTTTMRRANFEVEKNKVIQQRAEAERQPNLNFATNLGLNLGRALDPTTSSFETASILYNNFALESDMTLYDGGQTKKRIKRSKLDIRASQAEADQLSKDISLDVLRAYLRILMAEENLENVKKNLAQTESWYQQTKNLVNGGLRSNADLREVEIQKARDEQRIIETQNFIDQSYVALKLILEIDPSLSLKVEKPKKIAEPSKILKDLSFKKVYAKALTSQPGVEGGELQLESLELAEKIARGTKAPYVSLFGGVYTNFSSSMKDFDAPNFSDTTQITQIQSGINVETMEPIEFRTKEIDNIKFPTVNYFNQLGNNLGLGFGVSLTLPILDRKSSQLNGEIARLDFLQKQEDNLQFKQQLRTEIQNSIADVKAAAAKLEAVEKTHQLLEAQIISMRNRFNQGNVNAFEYKTTINERDTAEIELVIAKYEFLLKKMVVEFYEGKKLSLRSN